MSEEIPNPLGLTPEQQQLMADNAMNMIISFITEPVLEEAEGIWTIALEELGLRDTPAARNALGTVWTHGYASGYGIFSVRMYETAKKSKQIPRKKKKASNE